jgi:hypothetical protein
MGEDHRDVSGELSAHRTRTNRRPEPQHEPAPAALVAAVNAVYEPLEDKQ